MLVDCGYIAKLPDFCRSVTVNVDLWQTPFFVRLQNKLYLEPQELWVAENMESAVRWAKRSYRFLCSGCLHSSRKKAGNLEAPHVPPLLDNTRLKLLCCCRIYFKLQNSSCLYFSCHLHFCGEYPNRAKVYFKRLRHSQTGSTFKYPQYISGI